MSLAPYGSGGEVSAIVEFKGDRSPVEDAWQQALGRYLWKGTAGVVQAELYLPRISSSTMFRDERAVDQPPPEVPAERTRSTTRQAVLRMTSAEQALEVLAALSLNKTLLAEVLGVSRPTLYEWLEGKEPNVANARRLTTLVQLLANAGVTAADALSPRFVREAPNDGEPPLLELLKAAALDEARVSKVLREAKALEDGAENDRLEREDRLRALGFEEPTAEQRKANLAVSLALREWPRD